MTVSLPQNPYAGYDAQANYHPIAQASATFGKYVGPIGYAFGAVFGAVAKLTGIGRPNTPAIVDIENARAMGQTTFTPQQWALAGYGPNGEGYLTPWADATKTGAQIAMLPDTSLFKRLEIGLRGETGAQARVEQRYPVFQQSPYLSAGQPVPQVVMPSLQPISQTSLETFLGSLRSTPQSAKRTAYLDYLNGTGPL